MLSLYFNEYYSYSDSDTLNSVQHASRQKSRSIYSVVLRYHDGNSGQERQVTPNWPPRYICCSNPRKATTYSNPQNKEPYVYYPHPRFHPIACILYYEHRANRFSLEVKQDFK
jgi:hypothetical protein